jgi:hypothetical protein
MDLYDLPDGLLGTIVTSSFVLAAAMFGLDFLFPKTKEIIDKLRARVGSGAVAFIRIVLGLISSLICLASGWLLVGPLPPPEPEYVVRLYWERVSNQRYQEAWEMLSPNFRCRWYPPCEGGDGDYEAFTKNWDSYREIRVGDAIELAQGEDGALLRADLIYKWADESLQDTQYDAIVFELVPPQRGFYIQRNWVINKTTYSEDEPPANSTPAPDEVPTFSNIRFCDGPCDQGGTVVSSFDGYTTDVYAAWDFDHMEPGMPYRREWYFEDMLWARYTCVWEGEISGTKFVSLFDHDVGLRGGLWTLRLTIGDTVESGSFVVNDTNSGWLPPTGGVTCPD